MAKPVAKILRVRMLRDIRTDAFTADLGEERSVMKAHGEQLLGAGDAELVVAPKPAPAKAPAPKTPAAARKR